MECDSGIVCSSLGISKWYVYNKFFGMMIRYFFRGNHLIEHCTGFDEDQKIRRRGRCII